MTDDVAELLRPCLETIGFLRPALISALAAIEPDWPLLVRFDSGNRHIVAAGKVGSFIDAREAQGDWCRDVSLLCADYDALLLACV